MTPTSDLQASDRAKALTDALQDLYKDIPELRQCRMIKLNLRHFQQMNDFKFIVLYDLIARPESKLECVISPKTLEYIDKRRKELGLNKAPTRGNNKRGTGSTI